jgi:hypothetical protein
MTNEEKTLASCMAHNDQKWANGVDWFFALSDENRHIMQQLRRAAGTHDYAWIISAMQSGDRMSAAICELLNLAFNEMSIRLMSKVIENEH